MSRTWARSICKEHGKQSHKKANFSYAFIEYYFYYFIIGCETWTITKNMEKKINACEMWNVEEDAKNIIDGEE